MSQEPKRRHSIARKGKRRASIKLKVSRLVVCKNCQSLYTSHTVCAKCGFYNGSQVIPSALPKKQQTVE